MKRKKRGTNKTFDAAAVAAALEAIRTRPTVKLWPTAAAVLGLSRYGIYEAANNGQIEILRHGKDNARMQAVSAALRRKLEIDA